MVITLLTNVAARGFVGCHAIALPAGTHLTCALIGWSPVPAATGDVLAV